MDLELLYEIGNWLLGTCNSIAAVEERFDVNAENLEDDLLEINIETCLGCGWWFESGELTGDGENENDEPGYRDECRKDLSR